MQEMDAAMAQLRVTPPEGAAAVGSGTPKVGPPATTTTSSSTPAAPASLPMDVDPVTPPTPGAPSEVPLRPRKRKGAEDPDMADPAEADAVGSEVSKAVPVDGGAMAGVHAGLQHHCAAECLCVVSSHQVVAPHPVSTMTVNELVSLLGDFKTGDITQPLVERVLETFFVAKSQAQQEVL